MLIYWKTDPTIVRISLKGLMLFAILISAVGISPVFAAYGGNMTTSGPAMNMSHPTMGGLLPPHYMMNQSLPIGTPSSGSLAVMVSTDKPSYNDGDKIMISGSTRDYMGQAPVTLILRNPIGNVITVAQITVGSDRTFSTSVVATGTLWAAAGTYTVSVQYSSQDRSGSTTFQFAGSHGGPGNTILVNGTTYSVTYSITNGKVLDVNIDPKSKSLIVSIQTTGDGALTITMPRSMIDAKKAGGADDQYFVLNDGQENDQFQETVTTTTDRTLQIPFTDGTSQIEIIGTFAIPEFGTIAVMILAIALVSIIAISAKTGLRFTPKV